MKKVTLLLFCFSSLVLFAQEPETIEQPFRRHHSLSLLLSHTHTSQGIEDGKNKWLVLPSWAFDYNYYLSEKWSLGLHNDMILETFKVKDHKTDQETVERTRPIASVVVARFRPAEHFTFELGAGGEFAKEGSFFLTRIGAEYALELHRGWELVTNINYEFKWQGYNSFSLGVGMSKAFGFRNKKK